MLKKHIIRPEHYLTPQGFGRTLEHLQLPLEMFLFLLLSIAPDLRGQLIGDNLCPLTLEPLVLLEQPIDPLLEFGHLHTAACCTLITLVALVAAHFAPAHPQSRIFLFQFPNFLAHQPHRILRLVQFDPQQPHCLVADERGFHLLFLLQLHERVSEVQGGLRGGVEFRK